MTAKRRNRKVISTPVSDNEYQRLTEIAKREDMTLSVFLKQAINAYCHVLGYDDIDLTEDISTWGGKREGSGRPPKENE